MNRRHFCRHSAGLLAAALAAPAWALTGDGEAVLPGAPAHPGQLSPEQSRIFRDWMACVVHAQLELGATPRWQQQDCAGLVRFAVAEALRDHDDKWLRAMSLQGRHLPPPLQLQARQRQLRHSWRLVTGEQAVWVGALELVQANTRLISRDPLMAQSGDLFFFDQGGDQHLMIWMGRYLAYHTGHTSPQDNGLRAYTLSQMLSWRDTRWKPHADNPNFAGVYRLNFVV